MGLFQSYLQLTLQTYRIFQKCNLTNLNEIIIQHIVIIIIINTLIQATSPIISQV